MSELIALSVVIPVCNEKDNIRLLYQEISAALKNENVNYEILFVDDGSTDGTTAELKALQKEDARIHIDVFRKNFGKSAALAQAFQRSKGQYLLTLDGDLQDDPLEFPRLLLALKNQDADIVCGWKKTRRDPFSKIISSRLFNWGVSWLTGVRVHDFNCGIKLLRREVAEEIPMYGELHRFIPALAAWKGFRVIEKPVHHRPRKFGQSKFGIRRFHAGIVDLITVLFLMRFERKPSHLFSAVGLLMTLSGTAICSHLFVLKLLGHTVAPRYPYLAVGVVFLMLGVQFIFFGLLSEMMIYSFKRHEIIPLKKNSDV